VHKYFEEYYWKNGIPQGRKKLSDDQTALSRSYKIVSDPYGKRISLERYDQGRFHSTLYDSILLDFRKLKPVEQQRWEKSVLQESADQSVEVIRNEDDRAIYIETCIFLEGRCRECRLSSVQGILLSFHRLYYMDLGDPFNGAVLYDIQENPVMKKIYAVDPNYLHFTDLLEENWNMENSSFKHL
jgi:hypothetical protein